MDDQKTIVIVSAVRTAMGNLGGSLSNLSAPELGTAAIKGAIEKASIKTEKIDEVLMGCVLTAGLGQAPARQAALGAGLPTNVPCTTINKMCGSGMKAVMLAHDEIIAGSFTTVIAGGMENMSQAPYLMPKGRFGYRLGHNTLYDHMMLDGLEDAYDKGTSMGVFSELCADKYQFTRETLDQFAIQSLQRAKTANEDGSFKEELIPITVKQRKSETIVNQDENPFKAKLEKIPQLKPAFKKDGMVTAANSSSISDGASALILTTLANANTQNLKPLATIKAHSSHAQAPEWFTTAPVEAIKKVLNKANWTVDDVDLFEINEAFAVVTLSAITELKLDPSKVNIHGGACALGHPIGASGARIITTLIHALKKNNLNKGIAALCIGGGEATAIALEII